MWPGAPFSALTRPSSPEPRIRVWIAGSKGSDDLVGFQSTFLRANHQKLNRVVATRQKKTLCVSCQPCLLPCHKTDRKGIHCCLPFELVIWRVSEILCSQVQPTIHLAGVDAIQSKMTFGVVDKRPLLCVIPTNLPATERNRLNDSLAVELPISQVSKMTC